MSTFLETEFVFKIVLTIRRTLAIMDKEIFNKAIQKYIADPEKSIPKLMEYAGPLRVKKLAKDLIGVWL